MDLRRIISDDEEFYASYWRTCEHIYYIGYVTDAQVPV